MITFTIQDNGNAPDRWPHCESDIRLTTIIKLFSDNALVGSAVVCPDTKRFVSIIIDKSFRSLGYGSKLFDYVLSNFEITNFSTCPYDEGIDFIGLITWYERRGFKPVKGVEMEKA